MKRLKILLCILTLAIVSLVYSNNLIKKSQANQAQANINLLTSLERANQSQKDSHIVKYFYSLIAGVSEEEQRVILSEIENTWDIRYVPLVLETIMYSSPGKAREVLINLLKQSVKQNPLKDFDSKNPSIQDYYFWLWNQKLKPVHNYDNFKAALYKNIDPKFEKYFSDREETAKIRLDEIRWGGVVQDGIPPLHKPVMLSIEEADYLADGDIIFGIEINGDSRAYPKRILAWHEMFTDTIGGVDIAGVYCTLCGTVIPYRTEHKGVKYQLGTSGFLYRSNKLMYDKATQSLWSTTKGIPVVGPLVDKGIELEFESVVTTNWGEWKKRHPKTRVLSLNTGFNRDYGEGVAYSDYFATDEVMFNTPFIDSRLDNKREVLALTFVAAPNQQLAIDTAFLNQNPLYSNSVGIQKFIVLTDKTGANRVYDPKGIEFVDYNQNQTLIDSQGKKWRVNESTLESEDGEILTRLPYRRAFWFGWKAAYPETQLIK